MILTSVIGVLIALVFIVSLLASPLIVASFVAGYFVGRRVSHPVLAGVVSGLFAVTSFAALLSPWISLVVPSEEGWWLSFTVAVVFTAPVVIPLDIALGFMVWRHQKRALFGR